jgi:hypothetical protein
MMRGVLAIYFLTLAMSCAFGSEAQGQGDVLVIDVYSAKIASDVTQEKGFWLWTQALKEGHVSPDLYPNILHEEHPLGEAFEV